MLEKLLIGVLLLSAQVISAADRYVSDVLYIPVRTGASKEYKILGYLKSGDLVTTKEESGEFIHILFDGRRKFDGWVKSRFLVDEPVAAVRLEAYKTDVKKLAAIKSDLVKFKTAAKQAIQEKESYAKQLEHIRNVSQNVIQLDETNKSLTQEMHLLKKELASVKEQNHLLQQNQRNEGIKLGILAIALGAIVGFALPYMKPRNGRRHSSIRLR